jgi:hypothetical protein
VIGFTDALSFHPTISTLGFFTLAAKLSAEGYGSLFRIKLYGRSQQRPQGCLSTALDEPCIGGSEIDAPPALDQLVPG